MRCASPLRMATEHGPDNRAWLCGLLAFLEQRVGVLVDVYRCANNHATIAAWWMAPRPGSAWSWCAECGTTLWKIASTTPGGGFRSEYVPLPPEG
jgi:hypothetical protein